LYSISNKVGILIIHQLQLVKVCSLLVAVEWYDLTFPLMYSLNLDGSSFAVREMFPKQIGLLPQALEPGLSKGREEMEKT
jgi:hypothetical protein